MAYSTNVTLSIPKKFATDEILELANEEFNFKNEEYAIDVTDDLVIFTNDIRHGVTELEELLVKKGIPFDRETYEMEVSGQPEIRMFRPESGDFNLILTGDFEQEPFLKISEIEHLLDVSPSDADFKYAILALMKEKNPKVKLLTDY